MPPNPNRRKLQSSYLFVFLSILATGVAAFLLGRILVHYRDSLRSAEVQRELNDKALLQMSAITLGRKLPDLVVFDSLSCGSALSHLLIGNSLLVLVDGTCESCVNEIEMLCSYDLPSEIRQRIIAIGYGNVAALDSVLKHHGRPIALWNDGDPGYMTTLRPTFLPLNLVVDSTLSLVALEAGGKVSKDFVLQYLRGDNEPYER